MNNGGFDTLRCFMPRSESPGLVEFEKDFAERGEKGAACAIYHKGKKVVITVQGQIEKTTPSDIHLY